MRVERTPENRTITTSGILQRAVKYSDDDNESRWNAENQDPNLNYWQTMGGTSISNVGEDLWKGANRTGMAGKFGNYHNSIFTPTVQDYCSHRWR